MICPICDIGEAEQVTEDNEDTQMRYHLCNWCASEFATPQDLRYNKAKSLAYKKSSNNSED